MSLRSLAEVLRADQLSLIQLDVIEDAGPLSDLDLLADALAEARAARESGEILGPEVDELTLRRAERRARLSDGSREHNALVLGGVA
ncbi:hypothetical protein [Lentzea sp. NPDC055074]